MPNVTANGTGHLSIVGHTTLPVAVGVATANGTGPLSGRTCMTAAVNVGIVIGLFAQHALDAVATGAMLEAKSFLLYFTT